MQTTRVVTRTTTLVSQKRVSVSIPNARDAKKRKIAPEK